MNTFRESLTEYLAMRRSLGFKLREAGHGLFDFVSFMEERNAGYITSSLALEWAQQPDCSASHWGARLCWIRGFASFLAATDGRTEVPPSGLFPATKRRARPYIYSDDEVQRLMQATKDLKSMHAIKPQTYYCLFGLLAVSGMRIGELLNLKVTDVDLAAAIITVVGTKLGKSRLVPLRESTCRALLQYKQFRDDFLGAESCDYFFVGTRGMRLRPQAVGKVFRQLCLTVGLDRSDKKTAPRVHDFRHRFAVQTLVHWYQNGDDIESKLPVLSTYLGHVHIADTYWYLSACPDLMGLAVKRLDQRWEVPV